MSDDVKFPTSYFEQLRTKRIFVILTLSVQTDVKKKEKKKQNNSLTHTCSHKSLPHTERIISGRTTPDTCCHRR